ncbi:uncharacterized protein LOC144703165 [Wolffia australiana]
MGNYVACGLVGRRPKAEAVVVLPGGKMMRLSSPTTAAELMLEAPGYFAVCADEIHVGRRLRPMTADEALQMGQVYLMLPMKRVNATATVTDMDTLWRAAAGEAPIQPAKDEEAAAGPLLPPELLRPRLTVSRSRKPSLETIAEETVLSTR